MLLLSGVNGSGKSTMLRLIAGLYPPLFGRADLRLQDGTKLPRQNFSHYLSEKNAMKAQLSVCENLRFWQCFFAAGSGAAGEAARASALSAVQMAAYADLPFAALSTGQKRRIGLSRLLLCPRPLWLLDEPTSGLDETGCRLFAQICRRHLAGGGLIIAATHLPLGLSADKTLFLADFAPKSAAGRFCSPLENRPAGGQA